MLTKLLQRFENPLHPLLGPTLRGLQKWGMWLSNKGLQRSLYQFLHISAIVFVLSQYLELWLLRSHLEQAMRNLSVTMLSTVCVVKAGTFVVWQKYWKTIIQYVSTLEIRQLSMQDQVTNRILREYTKYSRTVTYFYWCLVTTTVFTVILAPLLSVAFSRESMDFIRNGSAPYPEIMSSWVPFDKSKGLGYWFYVLEHALICFYGGGIVANYDSNAVVLMSFFVGQLKLLQINCARLFGDENKIINYEEAMKRIRECHVQHLDLVKNAKLLNSLLSPVMFLYIIVCSLMICACAIQLSMDGTTRMQQIWLAEYLIALIAQLFLYCWHSNEVLFMSMQVDRGVYASAWWAQDMRVRRSVVLLAGQLRKTLVFTAGPFTQLTVATFVAEPNAMQIGRLGHCIRKATYLKQKANILQSWLTRPLSHHFCAILIASYVTFVTPSVIVTHTSGDKILKGSYSYYTLLSQKEENN